MAALVLGPMLRYVGETEAVIWVETDAACEVETLGASERTFQIQGHHYGLVHATGLEPATRYEYEVSLDGERAWPEPDSPFPPSAFRTYPKEEPLRIAFGSCRVCMPHEEPYTLTGDQHPLGMEVDALRALATRMLEQEPEERPDLLLMLGDQVYADDVSPATRAFIETRRRLEDPPGERVNDYDEYARLYQETWGEPMTRWLLSTVSTAMVFDDHDLHDDWNISSAWLEEIRQEDWWHDHIVAGLASYWIYQHLGNLAPGSHDDEELLHRIRAEHDGWDALREFAGRGDHERGGSRWSYCRDLGDTRLVVIDSRAGRQLDEGDRRIVDDGEWDWIAERATGGFDHLLIATSVPFVLAPGMHYFEAWNEALCAGAWGPRVAERAEAMRQSIDLEHWPAFQKSFVQLSELQRSVGAGERGTPPASIVTLSGDVHHAYLAEIGFPKGSGVRSGVWQAVCSPFRNPLERKERGSVEFGFSGAARLIGRALARAAGVEDPPIRWRFSDPDPIFDNVLGMLHVNGRQMEVTIEKSFRDDRGEPRLEPVLSRRLA